MIRCQNCGWGWNKEVGDRHPFLCHKCGFDSKIGDFDIKSLQIWEKENNYPFDEYIKEGYHIRTFYEDINDNELVWHRDREDRLVESVGFTDWMLQMDNELPKPLTESTLIPKNTYHRVIKGTNNLVVKIKKL
jgi:hypothetical protein